MGASQTVHPLTTEAARLQRLGMFGGEVPLSRSVGARVLHDFVAVRGGRGDERRPLLAWLLPGLAVARFGARELGRSRRARITRAYRQKKDGAAAADQIAAHLIQYTGAPSARHNAPLRLSERALAARASVSTSRGPSTTCASRCTSTCASRCTSTSASRRTSFVHRSRERRATPRALHVLRCAHGPGRPGDSRYLAPRKDRWCTNRRGLPLPVATSI